MTFSKMIGNLLRTQEILLVFFRQGFGDLLQRMGLTGYLKAGPLGAEKPGEEVKTTPRRFRDSLEELGGAFVKLGQMLSTRPDILPRAWVEELTPLQDDVAPVPYEDLRKTLEEDLGPAENNFRFIDPTPLAAASIAQVHPGILLTGEEVVVKIRKPGVKKTVLQDCDILRALAELMENHIPESRTYRPVRIVEEFRKAIVLELDFAREGQNLDRFRSDFRDSSNILFPRPFWGQTSERVLTMERLDGVKISLIDDLRTQGVDTRRLARNLADAILRQTLEFGFFHGDPHPGNLIVVDGDRLGFLDCGMVGSLDERMRENLVLLVSAAIRKDTDLITDLLIEMNAIPQSLDRSRFLKEADLFLERYHRIPLKRIRLSSIVEDSIELIHKFKIEIPADLILVAKAMVTLEGLGRALDPEFDAVATAEPIVKEMVLTTYGPKIVARKVMQGSREFLRLIRDLPADLRELAHILRDNQLRIVVEHRGLREAFDGLDRASRRVSTSIVLASIVVASSIVALSADEPRFLGVPVIGLVGFCIAGLLAIGVIISTLIRGKH